MKKSITAVLALSLAAALPVAWGDVLQIQKNAPERYVVKKGDTLWDISGRFLTQPWRWPEIWRLNKQQIKDPHWIYPGNVIVLDHNGVGGGPQLRLEAPTETVKLSPQVHSEPIAAQAIPPIPPHVIEPFLTQPLVIEDGGLAKAPRIVAMQERHVNIGAGGIAYVSGFGATQVPLWQIYRQGKPLVDPDTNKTLAYEAVFLGTARVERQGDPATIRVVTSKQEITAGDRLVAARPPEMKQYVPHSPDTPLRGRVIGLYDGMSTSEGGKYSIVSLNKGARDGLELGHVLALYRQGITVPDPDATVSHDAAKQILLPEERYGLVFVFRTFDAVSYALVMQSSRPVRPGDVLQTP